MGGWGFASIVRDPGAKAPFFLRLRDPRAEACGFYRSPCGRFGWAFFIPTQARKGRA
jgi:hypothetical protein